MPNPFTHADIDKDCWNAVYQPIPDIADIKLVARAIDAAAKARDEAQAVVSNGRYCEDAEKVAYSAEMSYAREMADRRIEELTARLVPGRPAGRIVNHKIELIG